MYLHAIYLQRVVILYSTMGFWATGVVSPSKLINSTAPMSTMHCCDANSTYLTPAEQLFIRPCPLLNSSGSVKVVAHSLLGRVPDYCKMKLIRLFSVIKQVIKVEWAGEKNSIGVLLKKKRVGKAIELDNNSRASTWTVRRVSTFCCLKTVAAWILSTNYGRLMASIQWKPSWNNRQFSIGQFRRRSKHKWYPTSVFTFNHYEVSCFIHSWG